MRIAARAILGAAAAGAAVIALSTPAAAVDYDEYNETTQVANSSMNTADVCVGVGNATGTGCFKKDGDVFLVQDTLPDGMAVYVNWENQLRNANGVWMDYRSGTCKHRLGAGTTGACNKDFYENSSSNAVGGKGSRIRFKTCSSDPIFVDPCSGLTSWIYNN